MALTRTRTQIRDDVRSFTDTAGATSLKRHPNADIDEYINHALGSLHRKLSALATDQRILSTSSFNTASGTSTYALPSDFDFLISVDITIDGKKHWLTQFEPHERPDLTTPDAAYVGKPFSYRLRGGNIELLPTPQAVYAATVWYTPTASQLASDGATYDTIARLDTYVVAYASRFIATKDKNWDLLAECKTLLAEMDEDILILSRGRDRNSPPRIVDTYVADRWGRRRRW